MKVLIIAEAGVNHNGDLNLAKKLIDVAVEAKADFVKFQTFRTELAISRNAELAEYQKNVSGNVQTQFDLVKKLELDRDAHVELIDYCKSQGIKFLSTPFDLESIDLLLDLGIELFKIPSGEITNYPFLKKIAGKQLPVILSTGMSTMDEIEQALNVLCSNGLSISQITILHCNTEYPTPMEDVNLKAMLTIRDAFNTEVGYSDHTLGIEIPIAAVAMGATVIEKHFTLDRKMEGPDHKASLEPEELKAMILAIRNLEKAFGSGIKEPSNSEKKNISIARKSIVASKQITQGEVFSEDNITVKRPGTGLSPMLWDNVLGRVAGKDYNAEQLIEL